MAVGTLTELNKELTKARQVAAEKNARQEIALGDGLRIRVSPSGSASFMYRYRAPGTGALKVLTLGHIGEKLRGTDLETARDAHRKVRAQRTAATDPQEKRQEAKAAAAERAAKSAREKAEKNLTVRRLKTLYLDHISAEGTAGFLKTWKEIERLLERHIIPEIGHLPVSGIEPSQCARILKAMSHTPILRNRVLSYAKAMWGWGIREAARGSLIVDGRKSDMLPFNPWAFERQTPETPRNRVLTPAELHQLVTILATTPPHPARDTIELTLLTGVRKSEAAFARREEFDLEHGTWTIPAERMKAGIAHTVYLSTQAKALVERILASHAEAHLFPSDRVPGQPFSDMFGWVWLHKRIPDVGYTIHDMRRTFSTWLGERLGDDGMPIFPDVVIDRCIAHTKRGVIGHYVHARLNEPSRRAWQQWADHLDSLLDEKVTPIRGRA